jgi:hypothetical protein
MSSIREWWTLQEALAWVKCRDAAAVAEAMASMVASVDRQFDDPPLATFNEAFARLPTAVGNSEIRFASDAWSLLVPTIERTSNSVRMRAIKINRIMYLDDDGEGRPLPAWRNDPVTGEAEDIAAAAVQGFFLCDNEGSLRLAPGDGVVISKVGR